MNLERVREQYKYFFGEGMGYFIGPTGPGFPNGFYEEKDSSQILAWLKAWGAGVHSIVPHLNIAPCRESFEALLLLTEELL